MGVSTSGHVDARGHVRPSLQAAGINCVKGSFHHLFVLVQGNFKFLSFLLTADGGTQPSVRKAHQNY